MPKAKKQEKVTLADLIVKVGGWPFNVARVAALLKRADILLTKKGQAGCETTTPLTDEEVSNLTFEILPTEQ